MRACVRACVRACGGRGGGITDWHTAQGPLQADAATLQDAGGRRHHTFKKKPLNESRPVVALQQQQYGLLVRHASGDHSKVLE